MAMNISCALINCLTFIAFIVPILENIYDKTYELLTRVNDTTEIRKDTNDSYSQYRILDQEKMAKNKVVTGGMSDIDRYIIRLTFS